MSQYWRLKKQADYQVAREIRKTIPLLKSESTEWICDRLAESDFVVYKKELVKTPALVRLSIIPALVVMAILFIFMPANYIISGHWGYKWQWLENWLSSLGF